MIIKGDSHRFGRQISFDINSPIIHKPRSTYIEYLFLDERSPISSHHKSLGINTSTNINILGDWEGECENLSKYIITDVEISENIEELSIIAGKLIATATVLGFNDLHFENVLFIRKNNILAIIPVDLEIIFYKFITSAECCLYPSVKVSKEQCGFARLIPYLEIEHITLLIDNMIEAWDAATKLIPKIESCLGSIPVRVIYRPTRVYAKYLLEKNTALFASEPVPLTPEEIFQLNYGDIPYFFSYYDSPGKICYFNSLESIKFASEISNHPATKRHLSGMSEGKKNTFFLTSISHLLVNLVKAKGFLELKIRGKNFETEASSEFLTISILKQIVKIPI